MPSNPRAYENACEETGRLSPETLSTLQSSGRRSTPEYSGTATSLVRLPLFTLWPWSYHAVRLEVTRYLRLPMLGFQAGPSTPY